MVIAIAAALPLAGLGWWQSDRFAAQAREEAERALLASAHDVVHDVAMLLRLRVEHLELLARRAALLESWYDTERVRGLFDGRYGTTGFTILYLGDPWGTALYASPARGPDGAAYAGINYSDRAFFRRMIATRVSTIGDATQGRRSAGLVVGAAAPVYAADGALRGFVGGGIELAPLLDFVAANAHGTTRILITDERGSVITDTAGELAPLSRWTLRGGTRGSMRVADPNTRRWIRLVSLDIPVTSTTWTAHLSIDDARHLAATDTLRRTTMLATAVALLLMVVSIYAIATTAAIDLRHLADTARRVGKGDYTALAAPSTMAPREVVEVWRAMDQAVRDLKDQRAVQTALVHELQASNEQLRTFATGIRDVHDGVLVLDASYRVTYANAACLRLGQMSSEAALGKRIDQLDLQFESATTDVRHALRSERPWDGLLRVRRSDGSTSDVEVGITPLVAEGGATDRFVALIRDVTVRRQNELAMQQTERLASLGLLAAGVAHEINNPMTYVLGNLEELAELCRSGMLSAAAAAELDLASCLDDCLHGARRVVQIVADLRQLSRMRSDPNGSDAAEAREAIEVCLRLAHSQLRHCEIERDLPAEPLWLRISSQHLGQVLLNLVVNAGQAMEAQGPRNRLTVRLRQIDATRAEIEISDTGAGMSEETLRRIFDPFFTTKRAGVGTGLGLSICRSLVTAADGEIFASSVVGKGSTFRVLLPMISLAGQEARDRPNSAITDRHPLPF